MIEGERVFIGVLTVFGRGKVLLPLHWKVTAVLDKEQSSKNGPGTGQELKGMGMDRNEYWIQREDIKWLRMHIMNA